MPLTRVFVATTITHVVVYTDRARVSRTGTFPVTDSLTELAVDHLPLTLDEDSIRVSGSGTVAVQILGVSTEHIFSTEPVAEREADLVQQIKDVEIAQRSLLDQQAALNSQRQFVNRLGEKSADRFSGGLARREVGLSETQELLTFLRAQITDFNAEAARIQQQLTEINRQLEVLRLRLQQVHTPQPQQGYRILVSIAVAGTGELTLEVSYQVQQARWIPLYDLRCFSEGSQVAFSYMAEIEQQSGEDWTDVVLTLSTAKPGLGTLPPRLDPWYLDLYSPSPPRMMMVAPAAGAMRKQEEVQATVGAGMEDSDASFPLAEAQVFQAEAAPTQVDRCGSVVNFTLSHGSDIPSDGNPHKVTVLTREFPCQLSYRAIPSRVTYAYLQAAVTNPPEGVTILAGKANVFRDEMFIGSTELAAIAPGQAFTLNLGIDESLQLERILTERVVDRKLIGGQRRIVFAYRIGVTNLQEREAQLTVVEQIPVSRNEHIKVRLSKTDPQITPGEMGILEWSLVLAPHAKREIIYQFGVEYPPNLTLTGLDR